MTAKEILKEALEECERDRERVNAYSRLGHLKGAVMVALSYLAGEVKREEKKAYCFGCDEDVPVDEYNHLKELCNSCIDRGR